MRPLPLRTPSWTPAVKAFSASVCNSIMENFDAALRWIAEGKVKTEGLATLFAPRDAQQAYEGLLVQSLPTVAAVFDWRKP